jgi:hypothetical protein
LRESTYHREPFLHIENGRRRMVRPHGSRREDHAEENQNNGNLVSQGGTPPSHWGQCITWFLDFAKEYESPSRSCPCNCAVGRPAIEWWANCALHGVPKGRHSVAHRGSGGKHSGMTRKPQQGRHVGLLYTKATHYPRLTRVSPGRMVLLKWEEAISNRNSCRFDLGAIACDA